MSCRAMLKRAGAGLLATAFAVTLAGCGEGQLVPDGPLAELPVKAAEIVPASAIVEQADVPTVDPSRLEDADIAKAFGGPASCVFRYTPDGAPVVAFSDRSDGGTALVKVNGDLVVLDAAEPAAPATLAAASGPVSLAMATTEAGGWGVSDGLLEADLRFVVGDELNVGYGGYTDCAP